MKHALWLAAAVVIVGATYAPQLGAPFELQDDHRIIEPALAPHGSGLQMWLAAIAQDVHEVGRFRPVNQFFDVCLPLILGPNPLLWHALSLALAIAVTVLLYAAALALWRSPAAATVFALVTMLAPDPGPAAAWYRLGPKESWGMLFLAGALLLMVKRRDVWAFVLIVLMALSKESFLLLVPALFAVRMWLGPRDRRTLRIAAIAYGLLFAVGCIGILAVMRSAGAHSYGGQSMAVGPKAIAATLLRDLAFTPALAVWFVPVLLAWWRRRRIDLVPLVLFALWAGPQYLLYGTRGGFWDHYWLPCAVAFAGACAASVAVLANDRWPYRLALGVFAIWAVNAIRIDAVAAQNFKIRAAVQQEAVHAAAAHLTPSSRLIVFAGPYEMGELALSFVEFVGFDGGRFRGAVLIDPRSKVEDADVIVNLDRGQRPVPPRFTRLTVTGPQRFLSLRRRGWVTLPFSLDVDVRNR
jgi:hypothetical protein